MSKPTWHERQTFYARTARATLINFDAKAIEVVFQNLRDLRDEMITTWFLSALRNLTSNPRCCCGFFYQFFSELLITSKTFLHLTKQSSKNLVSQKHCRYALPYLLLIPSFQLHIHIVGIQEDMTLQELLEYIWFLPVFFTREKKKYPPKRVFTIFLVFSRVLKYF